MKKISSHPEIAKKLPDEVKILFKIFGDDIRLVGGSVRNLLIGKKPKDFDFATKFVPQKTMEILQKNKIKAIPTGVKYGTVTAVINGKNFEITTLRGDKNYDGRHPEVEFISDYFSDAARRDFTMNALYLDSKGLVTDYFGGTTDLKNKKVKFIGDAKERINEDYLRILRFFRFSCEYAKSLDIKGLQACVSARKNIKKLSRERIRQEFLKLILTTEKSQLITILKTIKSKKIAPEIFSANLDSNALSRLFEIEKKLKFSADLQLKIAALFLQENINLAVFEQEICATNIEKKYFKFLLSEKSPELDLAAIKQLLAFFDKKQVSDFYLFHLVKNFDSSKISAAKKIINFLEKFSLPDFPLSGQDVMQLGFKDEEVGAAIAKSKKFWAANNFKLEKNALINFLNRH